MSDIVYGALLFLAIIVCAPFVVAVLCIVIDLAYWLVFHEWFFAAPFMFRRKP